MPLILVSMLFNYAVGESITKDKGRKKISKKQLLVIGIIGNVSLLAYLIIITIIQLP